MNLTFGEILQATGGKKLAGEFTRELTIGGVSTDTRAIDSKDLFSR